MDIDLTALNKEIDDYWVKKNRSLEPHFRQQMNVSVYDWPRQTVTKSGNPKVKGSPRKITDTGELEGSYYLQIQGDTAIHGWSADHAAIVAFGGTNKNGTYSPPRDWWTPVIEREFD